MLVELINTGTELMLGRVLNTHQQWLCRQLADLGYVVTRQVAVPDTGSDIQQAVREALARADLVITTGGLGPTSDDITRDLIAQMLGKAVARRHGGARRTSSTSSTSANGPCRSGRACRRRFPKAPSSCTIRTAPRRGWRWKCGPIRFAPAARRAGWSCCPARRGSCGPCSRIRSCRCSGACCRWRAGLSAAR